MNMIEDRWTIAAQAYGERERMVKRLARTCGTATLIPAPWAREIFASQRVN
jgi:hypothetical protein